MFATKVVAENESAERKWSSAAQRYAWPAPDSVLPSSLLQRKTACACGGGCPRCQKKSDDLKVQTKLAISTPGDEFEQEADAVADHVMRMADPVVQRQSCPETSAPSPDDEEEPRIQRQTNGEGGGGGEVAADFTSSLGAGAPLDTASRAYFEPRFGHDFGNVRIHSGPQADKAAASVQARAFTLGRDVVFAAGEHDPGSESGKRLLAHELTHVVQQSGAGEICVGERHGPVGRRGSAGARVQRVPTYIVAATFLGNGVGGGVNPVMRTRLRAAETAIQATFSALPAAQQIHFSTGQPTTSHTDWAGITSVGGWRASTSSRHGSGSAVDLNYNTNPYIATGTVASPGGENGPGGGIGTGGTAAVPGIDDARSRAIEVYQRAVTFIVNDGFEGLPNLPQSDVRPRQTNETTGAVYDRFRQTSDALRDYLQFAFMSGSPAAGNQVIRAPIPNVETATEAVLLARIPLTERRDQATAVAALDNFMRGPRASGIIEFNPWYALTPDEQYIRILRDYELVRVPMQFGAVSTSPAVTRNPANGFLDIRREVAIALVDQGLHWLASDLTTHSGDVMHFDIRDHAGYAPGV
jgi:hypothetical protein